MCSWDTPQRQEGGVLSSISFASLARCPCFPCVKEEADECRICCTALRMPEGRLFSHAGTRSLRGKERATTYERCPPFPADSDSSPACSQACSEADWTRKTGWVSTSRSNSSSEEF